MKAALTASLLFAFSLLSFPTATADPVPLPDPDEPFGTGDCPSTVIAQLVYLGASGIAQHDRTVQGGCVYDEIWHQAGLKESNGTWPYYYYRIVHPTCDGC